MSDSGVSRRSFIGTSGAVSMAAGKAVVVPTVLMSNLKAAGAPLKILTTYQFEPHEVQEIQKAAPRANVEIIICADRAEYQRRLPEAEVIFGGVRAADLKSAGNLKWVQAGGAGVEGMEKEVRDSPVVMTNYARTFAPGISETAIGLLLCLTRGITKYYVPQFYKRQMNPVGTPKSDHHIELIGLKMGIVGMGGIGMAIARRAYYGFDMRIVGTDARPLAKPEFVEDLRDPSWFPEMVPQVDVLVAAAPHTPETERMFNEKVFRSMKKTAYFLGMSRGMLFDDMALVRALKEGWIAGAGLDVMPKEPPPSDHPIFDCPNVVMSAHTSGWSPDRQKRLIALFAENVRRYTEGIPLINVVDKQRGY